MDKIWILEHEDGEIEGYRTFDKAVIGSLKMYKGYLSECLDMAANGSLTTLPSIKEVVDDLNSIIFNGSASDLTWVHEININD